MMSRRSKRYWYLVERYHQCRSREGIEESGLRGSNARGVVKGCDSADGDRDTRSSGVGASVVLSAAADGDVVYRGCGCRKLGGCCGVDGLYGSGHIARGGEGEFDVAFRDEVDIW